MQHWLGTYILIHILKLLDLVRSGFLVILPGVLVVLCHQLEENWIIFLSRSLFLQDIMCILLLIKVVLKLRISVLAELRLHLKRVGARGRRWLDPLVDLVSNWLSSCALGSSILVIQLILCGLQDILLIWIIPDLSEGTAGWWRLELDLSLLEVIQGLVLESVAFLCHWNIGSTLHFV